MKDGEINFRGKHRKEAIKEVKGQAFLRGQRCCRKAYNKVFINT
jgi:hypothetical protein